MATTKKKRAAARSVPEFDSDELMTMLRPIVEEDVPPKEAARTLAIVLASVIQRVHGIDGRVPRR